MKAYALFLDKLAACVIWFSTKWLSVSARVGYGAYRGKAWGRFWERVIDAVFGAGHCRLCAVAEGLIA